MHRTRFGGNILTEFLPPLRVGSGRAGRDKVIVLCDGMPSIPRKQELAEFLARKGYWVFYPRYRGSWESGGEFLERSPHLDILAVVDGLNREIRELAFGKRFRVRRGQDICDRRKLWGCDGNSVLAGYAGEQSDCKLSGGGLGDSAESGKGRDHECKLCGLHSAGVWAGIPAIG